MAKFIVIDGLDGSGKATQVKIVSNKLEDKGYKVYRISFPKYDSKSSEPIKMYLNGEISNNPNDVNPYMCASFYAVDRFIQFEKEYKKYFENNDKTVIISDRYISANIIHQTSKIKDIDKREECIKWCFDFEYKKCRLPLEDITIVLEVEPVVSQKLMLERYDGDNNKKDIHENNIEYLEKCHDILKESARFINKSGFGKWKLINCTTNNYIDSIDNINNKIMKEIYTVLNA